MTLSLRIQHRGGPYFGHIQEINENGDVIKVSTIKEKGDEVEVFIREGKTLKIIETDPFETDAYA